MFSLLQARPRTPSLPWSTQWKAHSEPEKRLTKEQFPLAFVLSWPLFLFSSWLTTGRCQGKEVKGSSPYVFNRARLPTFTISRNDKISTDQVGFCNNFHDAEAGAQGLPRNPFQDAPTRELHGRKLSKRKKATRMHAASLHERQETSKSVELTQNRKLTWKWIRRLMISSFQGRRVANRFRRFSSTYPSGQ